MQDRRKSLIDKAQREDAKKDRDGY